MTRTREKRNRSSEIEETKEEIQVNQRDDEISEILKESTSAPVLSF